MAEAFLSIRNVFYTRFKHLETIMPGLEFGADVSRALLGTRCHRHVSVGRRIWHWPSDRMIDHQILIIGRPGRIAVQFLLAIERSSGRSRWV